MVVLGKIGLGAASSQEARTPVRCQRSRHQRYKETEQSSKPSAV